MDVNQLVANAIHQRNHKDNPEVETITLRLPNYDGKTNVDMWLKKVELILRNRKYSKEQWTNATILKLKGAAETFWYKLCSVLDTEQIPWQTFKCKLKEQFNYAHSEYDTRYELQFLKYHNADQYIEKFQNLIIKLADWTEKEKMFMFTINLPDPLRIKILENAKCKTVDDMCHSLREHERIVKPSQRRGTFPSISTGTPMDLDMVDGGSGKGKQLLNLIDLDMPDGGTKNDNNLFTMNASTEHYDKLTRIIKNIDKAFDKGIGAFKKSRDHLDKLSSS
ncbi:hypothetical protein PCASD_02806 [Puccinia coronata f. sp. avenae]|uniref:Ty3 transposon capsid-like protein domain-containing protein n=1 Tax=Puccinia coronata f. sp. avenae TaxID=200324 RepID=A0A2N5VFX1_9BASI|nr:hypothetical protein PCASD_02806 [Puccinia coronata f. sp. avenae]